MLEEFLYLLPKKMPPYPDRNVGDDCHVSNEDKEVKDGLLESRKVAQIDWIQTCVSQGTCTQEDGIDVAKLERRFGIAAVAIDAATVHNYG